MEEEKNQEEVETSDEELEEGFDSEEEPEVEEEDLEEIEAEEDKDKLLQIYKKKLATAIKQKVRWREKALSSKKEEKKPEETPQKEVNPDEIDKMIEAKLQQKELDALDVSDKVKEEIQKHLKAGTFKSVKEAKNSPYVQFLIQQEQQKEKEASASVSPSETAKGGAELDFSEMSPADFDLTKEEDRKRFAEYKAWLKKQG